MEDSPAEGEKGPQSENSQVIAFAHCGSRKTAVGEAPPGAGVAAYRITESVATKTAPAPDSYRRELPSETTGRTTASGAHLQPRTPLSLQTGAQQVQGVNGGVQGWPSPGTLVGAPV